MSCACHVRECIEHECRCPICNQTIFIKNLKRSSSFATMVACIIGIQRNLFEAPQSSSPATLQSPRSDESGPLIHVNSSGAKKNKRKSIDSQSSASKKQFRKKNIRISLTGLSEEEKQIIYSSYHSVQSDRYAVEVASTYDSKSTTHLITSSNEHGLCQRTVKYLMGVLDGKWVVSFDCMSPSTDSRVLAVALCGSMDLRRGF